MKKGAMFGLDARIALAIFGALSVISGAALYSAIKTAKMEQLRQYLVEFSKATEAYYLDNGKKIPQYTASTLMAPDLLENRESLVTWKGPYLNSNKVNSFSMKDNITKMLGDASNVSIYLASFSPWATNLGTWNTCALNDKDCASYIGFSSSGNLSAASLYPQVFKDLDELVDGGDGPSNGKLRYLRLDSYSQRIYYMSMPYKRTT
tara:strand:+ start:813 stop:1430 length:618 start_codon:yes stop_codon:yes gene_type:complete